MRQFSRTLLGADPAEVREFLLAAAASLERVNNELAGVILERTALQAAVQHANAEVETLRAQLAEARTKLAGYRGQEAALARAVLDARQIAEELSRSAKEQAERTVAQAGATAKDTIARARQSAADLLRAARVHAQQAVEAADRTAAVRIAEVQIEAERLAAEARGAAAEVQRAAQQQIEEFIAGLEAFLGNREELAERLDTLTRHHAESLEIIGRLHAEVERVILPALLGLADTVTEKEPAPARPSRADRRDRADRGRSGGLAPVPEPVSQIVVSPVQSYLQATKLTTAVSRMDGVKSAHLRSYSKGTITIDVVAEAGTVAGIDPRRIDGGPVDVVEATDRRMVLRLGDVGSERTAGSGSHV